MFFLFSISSLNYKTVIIAAIVLIIVVAIIAAMTNSLKYGARYKSFYRKFDKTINKKFNGNILNENILNQYSKDLTNTYKSLKSKGKRLAKKYFDYYAKNLPEQAMLKSFITSDKNRNQLVLLLLDENDKVLYRWDKSKKTKGFIKASNKYQMLYAYIAFLFELPLNIHEGAPYRFVNHENEYVLTYQVVKKIKKRRKVKEKKLSKKELKALEKVAKAKAKKANKKKR